jgi:hypothetical protein
MTGRATGFCAGYSVPGYQNPIPGRAGIGFGRGFGGRGGGRGWRNQYYATGLTGWQRAASGWPSAYPPVPPYPVAPPYVVPSEQVTPKQEADALKNQIKYLEESIKAAQERIEELEGKEQ